MQKDNLDQGGRRGGGGGGGNLSKSTNRVFNQYIQFILVQCENTFWGYDWKAETTTLYTEKTLSFETFIWLFYGLTAIFS